jgi:tRNA pseudouridine13 synthase
MRDPTTDLPYALGGPVGAGSVKQAPEDFIVEEILGFQPSGEGEHVFLFIEKRGENTDYVARQLARHAGVPARQVGYAGLKDRQGLTRQWFSIQLPGMQDPDWTTFESDAVRILEVGRNARKLRKGAAGGNRFELTIRDLEAPDESVEERLATITAVGVPNYFGPQRFGREGRNLERALELFADSRMRVDPHQRGLYLSAARAEIFNRILGARVRAGNWNRAIPGDVFMFADSHSFFKPEPLAEDTVQRVRHRAIHPSGVLWGTTPSTATGEAMAIEQETTRALSAYTTGLERMGVATARRPFRLCPDNLAWTWPSPNTLRLTFNLPSGAYATTLLRELLRCDNFVA